MKTRMNFIAYSAAFAVLALLSTVIITSCESGSDDPDADGDVGPTQEELTKTILNESCVMCHSMEGIDNVIADIKTLSNEQFSDLSNDDFPKGLNEHYPTVESLSGNSKLPESKYLTENSDTTLLKAYVLHMLYELKSFMGGTASPEFSSHENFKSFSTFISGGVYHGCEVEDRLDWASAQPIATIYDPAQGMPPKWAEAISKKLDNHQWSKLSEDNRAIIRNEVDRLMSEDTLLNGGVSTCIRSAEEYVYD